LVSELESYLEYQKLVHIRFSRLILEESRSRFNHHPILNSRYLLQFLIGKGGFSEVYKAYDMLENRYVALKLHEIASNWSDERRENFIRHAYRENKILKSLNHPRIVQCYDVRQISSCF
jgi:tousled-like kinase